MRVFLNRLLSLQTERVDDTSRCDVRYWVRLGLEAKIKNVHAQIFFECRSIFRMSCFPNFVDPNWDHSISRNATSPWTAEESTS